MLSKLIKLIFGKEGQAAVLVILSLTFLLGFAAVSVDYGYLAYKKRSLQTAADASALAAAWELPNAAGVQNIAVEYAKSNAIELDTLEVDATIQNSGKEVKVELAHNYNTFFARVLGFDKSIISATATAAKIATWRGEALPFINIDFDYSVVDPVAWTKVGPGVKGTITNFFVQGVGEHQYFEVEYAEGIHFTAGFANPTGLNDIKLRGALQVVMKESDKGVKKFYLFSLSSSVIQSGKFTVNGKTKTVYLNKLQDFKNKDIIDPDQLVLIEVKLLDFKDANRTDIEREFTGNIFDLGNDTGSELPDFPVDNLSTVGNAAKLVE